MGIMYNCLENLNAEAQVYYDLWVRDKGLVEIMKVKKEEVEVTIYFLISMFIYFMFMF